MFPTTETRRYIIKPNDPTNEKIVLFCMRKNNNECNEIYFITLRQKLIIIEIFKIYKLYSYGNSNCLRKIKSQIQYI
jgi:hypothetical protein